MAEAKKGKISAVRCICPTCETNLIIDDEGNVLQSYYEPDQEKAKEEASRLGVGEEEAADGAGSTGSETIPDDKKEAIEAESESEDLEDDSEGEESEDFDLGGW